MPRSCEVCKALCAPPIYFPHPEDETVFRKMECEGIDSGRGKPGWFFKAHLGLCYSLLGKLMQEGTLAPLPSALYIKSKDEGPCPEVRSDCPEMHILSALMIRSQFLLCLPKPERP